MRGGWCNQGSVHNTEMHRLLTEGVGGSKMKVEGKIRRWELVIEYLSLRIGMGHVRAGRVERLWWGCG